MFGACSRKLVAARGVPVPSENIVLGVPEILLRFIRLRLLALLSHGGQTFRFLVSLARRIGAFAISKEDGASDQANKLKVLHTCLNISSKFEKPVRLGPKLETNSK